MYDDEKLETGQVAAIGLLVVIVALDVGAYVMHYPTRLLEWPMLAVIVLAVFVGFGKRVTRLAFDPAGGFSFEQALKRFEDLSDFVADVFRDPDKANVGALIATVRTRDIWTRLLVYRIILRSLLRKLLKENGVVYEGPVTGIKLMLSDAKKNGLIEPERMKLLVYIREITEFPEWGTGRRAPRDELELAMKEIPRHLESLASLVDKPPEMSDRPA